MAIRQILPCRCQKKLKFLLIKIYRINFFVNHKMEVDIAGQTLQEITIRWHQQSAADRGIRIKFLETSPNSGFAFFRSHMSAV